MFGINKNGTKHKIGIVMPASYPSARVTYGNWSVEEALDDAKIVYKDIPIAGKTLSNYYVAFDMGVDATQYQAIGFASVSGAWDTGLTVEVSTDNYMKLRSARTASYTVASNIKPIRVYFVKVGRIIPLS